MMSAGSRIWWRRADRAGALLLLVALGCGQDESPADGRADARRASREAAEREAPAERPGPRDRPSSATADAMPSLAAGVPGEALLERYAGMDLDAAFAAVSQGIRYEAYRGSLRGAAGTALARSGNSLDQSLLLAEVLRRNGYRVRFARGRLEGPNRAAALRGIYPPDVPAWELGPEYAPYDPASDASLTEAARDHFWVEVFQGADWLPLDPSFPRAVPGEAYAEATSRFERPADDLWQTVTVTLMEETRGRGVRELGRFEGRVVDVGLRPMALTIRRVPKAEPGSAGKRKGTKETIGGLGGALSGGSKKEEPAEETEPRLVAVEYQREFHVGDDVLNWTPTLVAEEERAGYVRREWLVFTVGAPGAEPLRVERTLYDVEAAGAAEEPAAARHYSIGVVPGPVYHEWLRRERERLAGVLDLKGWGRELSAAARYEPGSEKAGTAAVDLKRRGDLAGLAAGHLVALTYAAESDSINRRIARSNGVALLWSTPRILMTTVEVESLDASRAEATVTLDLRLDRVDAVPYPGGPARAAPLFQVARGMQSSILEGAIVARATGLETPVTTAVLTVQSLAGATPLLAIGPENPEALGRLEGLPPRGERMMRDALARGRDVIVPQKATKLGGRDRWGWWEVDPESGAMIGVMDDGQHQASTNYSLSLSRVSLDDRMGFAIGAIIGATGTLFTISGLMLEYGSATPEMIRAVEASVKSIMCNSCASKAGFSAGASGGASYGGDCMKFEKKIKQTVGASVSVSFCEQYQAGFTCASGMLLRGLKGQSLDDSSFGIGGTLGISGQLNCEKGTAGVTVNEGGVKVNDKLVIKG